MLSGDPAIGPAEGGLVDRRGKGEYNGNAVLNELEVRHIRQLLDGKKETAAAISRSYKVSVETIRRIGRRESWGWLSEVPVRSEEDLQAGAEASLAKLQRLMAEDKEKGKRGDELVKELMEKKGISETVAKQVAFYTGKDEEK